MDDCARLTGEGREEEEEEEWGGTGVYIGVVGLPRTPRVSCRCDCQECLKTPESLQVGLPRTPSMLPG